MSNLPALGHELNVVLVFVRVTGAESPFSMIAVKPIADGDARSK